MGYKFWYMEVFPHNTSAPLLSFSWTKIIGCFLVQSQISNRYHIPQNLMWSWGVFFFLHSEFIKNSIFDLQNREMLSVQQKCCSAFSKKKKNPTDRTTTLLSPHIHTSHSQTTITDLYFSMPSDYCIWQVKVLKIWKENSMFTKTNPSWKH